MNKNENQRGNPQHLYNILYLQREAFETLNPWIGTIVGSSNPPESEKNTAYMYNYNMCEEYSAAGHLIQRGNAASDVRF